MYTHIFKISKFKNCIYKFYFSFTNLYPNIILLYVLITLYKNNILTNKLYIHTYIHIYLFIYINICVTKSVYYRISQMDYLKKLPFR